MGRGITFTLDAMTALLIAIAFIGLLNILLLSLDTSTSFDINRKMETYLLSLKESGRLSPLISKIIEGQDVRDDLRKLLENFSKNGRICVSVWGYGETCYPEGFISARYVSQITFHEDYNYGVIRLELQ